MSARLSAILVALLLCCVPLSAVTFRSGEQITVAKGEVLDDDLFAAGSKVSIDGTVNGDVFAFAGDVTVRGKIKGELFAFAGNVVIEDTIAGPARIFAGTVRHKGVVAGNFMAFGGTVTSSGGLGRDATIKCGEADISGTIGRDLGLEAKQASVSGAVGNDAYLRVRSLSLGKLAVGRDLVYKTPFQTPLPAGVVAGGKASWQQLPAAKEHRARGVLHGLRLFIRWIWFLGALLVGLILIAISKKQSKAISDTIRENFWRCLGLGSAWLVLVPIAAIIVGLTLIGLPLAVFGMFAYVTALYLGTVFFAMLLGQMTFALFRKADPSPYLAFLAGIIIVFLLTLIPVLGVRLFAAVTGGGAVIVSRFAFLKGLRAAGTI
jgi:hypothetical protein